MGRMSAMAAYNLGYRIAILSDSPFSPAAQATPNVTVNAYTEEAILAFAKTVDILTYEFENINCDAIAKLEKSGHIVRPSSHILSTANDRLREKEFFRSQNLSVVPFVRVDSANDLRKAIGLLEGYPLILKQRRMGYDGIGQYTINDDHDLAIVCDTVDLNDHIVEKKIDFAMEMSVIVARGSDGQMVTMPIARNVHKDGILHTSTVPSGLSCEPLIANIAKKLACALNLVGILAIEMFFSEQLGIIINEMAPRPHNSGHWSLDCCNISQFDLHIRTVAGLPLVEPYLLFPCTMRNLIGDDISLFDRFTTDRQARLYMYGKSEVRPGRKMGHVNLIGLYNEKY